MSCQNRILNEDDEDCGPCGDEGKLCRACEASEEAHWLGEWATASLEERDPDAYRRDLRDAGRAHLLPPEE